MLTAWGFVKGVAIIMVKNDPGYKDTTDDEKIHPERVGVLTYADASDGGESHSELGKQLPNYGSGGSRVAPSMMRLHEKFLVDCHTRSADEFLRPKGTPVHELLYGRGSSSMHIL